MFTERSNSSQFLGVGLIQSPRLPAFLFSSAGLKTSTGRSSSLLSQGTGVMQSPRLPAFLFSSAGLKTSPNLLTVFIFCVRLKTSTGRFYSSIKLLKTSSIMSHSSSESSGIGCNSPSVPSSFSVNE